MINKTYTILIFSALLAISCGDDTVELQVPSDYSFERAGISTVAYSGQTTRILMASEFSDALENPEVTETQLLDMYENMGRNGEDVAPYSNVVLNSATKSVASKIAASKDFFATNSVEAAEIKADFYAWISSQVSETYLNSETLASTGIAGQILDGTSTRYVSARGLEYNQAIAKGIIGALMVDQILNNYLSTAVLDEGDNREANDNLTLVTDMPYTNMEHKWDEAFGYLFGNTQEISQTMATLGSDDDFLNKYLGRVASDTDFSTIGADIYEAFRTGRAAITVGDYSLRDKQADIIKEAISKVVAIRAVFYLQQGKNALIAKNYGSAFHDLSEGFGFVYSLRFTRKTGSADSYFSKSEVDGFISDMMSDGPNGFWDLTPQTLDAVSESIASKFDFTVAQAAE